MGSSKATIEYRKRRKNNLIKVCGSKCAICGYDTIQDALEFHHLNPLEKEFGIAENGNCHDLELDLKEIKKCILVCSNCHREIHAGLYSLEELEQKKFFDNDFANFLREEKMQNNIKKEYFCKECGLKLYEKTKTGLCATCYAKSMRVVNRPTREELKNLIRNKPFVQIAEMFHVTDNAIRKWCDAEKLPRKVTDIKKYSDAEWEEI